MAMILNQREKYIAYGSAAAMLLLVLDYFVLSPYLEERDAIAQRSTALYQKVDDENSLFERERHLKRIWEELQKGGLNVDASTAESQAQQAVIDWADASGMTLTGLRPGKTTPEGKFLVISFNVTGTGAMPDIARMLWSLETATIPVRVSDMQLKPRKEGTDDLLATFTLSTLCLPPESQSADHKPDERFGLESRRRAMNQFTLTVISASLCGLLVWLGITAARADLSSTLPATTQASSTSPSSTSMALNRGPTTQQEVRSLASAPNPPSALAGHGSLMPRDYTVLLTRSMFVRGHIAEAGHVGGGRNSARGGDTESSNASTTASLQRAETGLVFNGVTQTDTSIDALIEDTSTGRVLTVHSGDAIARGKVGKITMDALEYVNDGRVMKVQIGQNLAGGTADVSASPAATSQPVGSGASPQDILERLRARRLQGN